MGLFDKLRTTIPDRLNPRTALALGALTLIGIDGNIDEDEAQSAVRLVRGDQRALDDALRIYKDLSVEESVQLVAKAFDQRQKQAFIVNLLDLAMVDGVLTGSEQTLIGEYVNILQMSEAEVKGMVDLIALKNDFSVFAASSSPGATSFCSGCGAQLAPGAKFCTGCGTRG
jgi:uncharacterized tellurite resistance protein B-like protein